MSTEIDQYLGEYRRSQQETAVKIKQELVGKLESLGDDCPRIRIHDKEWPGIILKISAELGTDFRAVILEPKGIFVRIGYLREDQVMRFSDGGDGESGEVSAQQYIELAKIAEGRIAWIRGAARTSR